MGIDEPGAVNIIPISRAENICFGLKIKFDFKGFLYVGE